MTTNKKKIKKLNILKESLELEEKTGALALWCDERVIEKKINEIINYLNNYDQT